MVAQAFHKIATLEQKLYDVRLENHGNFLTEFGVESPFVGIKED